MKLYELFFFLTTPLCYFFKFSPEKKVKIDDNPEIYYVYSLKKFKLWYSRDDYFRFREENELLKISEKMLEDS